MSKAIAVMFSVVHHILLSDQFHLATGRLASAIDFTVTAISFQQLFTKQSGNIHFFPSDLCDSQDLCDRA